MIDLTQLTIKIDRRVKKMKQNCKINKKAILMQITECLPAQLDSMILPISLNLLPWRAIKKVQATKKYLLQRIQDQSQRKIKDPNLLQSLYQKKFQYQLQSHKLKSLKLRRSTSLKCKELSKYSQVQSSNYRHLSTYFYLRYKHCLNKISNQI